MEAPKTGLMSDKLTLDVGCGKIKRGDIGTDYCRDSEADVIADAHCLPFKNQVFDKVVSFNVLEHSPNPLDFLKEQYRVLKNTGFIYCETDNAQYYRWSTQKFGATTRHEDICADHHAIFMVKHVLRLMEKAGFKNVKWHFRRHNPTMFDVMALLFIKLRFWREECLYSRIITTGSVK